LAVNYEVHSVVYTIAAPAVPKNGFTVMTSYAERVHAESGHEIQITMPVEIIEKHALAARHHDGVAVIGLEQKATVLRSPRKIGS